MRATKILVTVGPATDSDAGIEGLLRAGADGFRLNFSHGSDEAHRTTLRRLRRLVATSGRPRAIVADLQGPKIRLGELRAPNYALRAGAELRLDTRPEPGDGHRVPVTYPDLTRAVVAGDPLLLGDGSVALTVTEVGAAGVVARVVNGGVLSAHAGLYLPRAKLRAELLGPKDRADLRLAIAEGVDFVAVSFVRDGEDLRRVRREIRAVRPGATVGLIAKIERAEALAHLDDILREAEAIMVARGDLGIEVPLERLALEQKALVRRATEAGRTVIVATQMLLSMVSSPRPTRAEATDVANAVLDGADAVMLSEESAVGEYPVEAVRWLDRIARATEPAIDRERFARVPATASPEAFVAESAVRLAAATRAGAIVTPTHSGRTARLVARHRPRTPVWAFCSNDTIRRQLALAWGVRSFATPAHQSLVQIRRRAVDTASEEHLPTGRGLVLTAGYPVEGRPTNLVTLVETTRPLRRRRRPAGR
jgi:pyruvate kinase